ncbi:hypothetical protein AVEN_32694-1, partial [Araneus ventricosus]
MAPRGNGAASGLFGPYRVPDVPLQHYGASTTTYTPNHTSAMNYYNTGRYSASPNCPPIQPSPMGYPGDNPEHLLKGSNFNGALQEPNLWRTSPTNPGLGPE